MTRRLFLPARPMLPALLAALALVVPAPSATATTAAVNQAPLTVPALTSWSGGHGTYRPPARITVHADRALARDAATTFVPELAKLTKRRVTLTGGRGDITLTQDSRRRELGAEGYALSIGDRVTVTAEGGDGAFYGTGTLLQLAKLGTAWPRGVALDVPRYRERGVGVCACYIHFSQAYFSRLMSDMSYLKLNQLQLELKVKSSRYPQADQWGYYTPAEARQLQALADRFHITLVPEVNSPGHIDPWITNIPSLQLVDSTGVRHPDKLDITKPAAFTFITSLIDDYAKVFHTPYWHMGADEYLSAVDYAHYPQLAAYAKKHYGPDATPQDAFIGFVNKVDNYVRAKGRTLRMWNDGVTSAATIELNSDIVVEHWLGSGVPPSQLLADGHQVENAAYSLYLVRGGFQMDTAKLYAQQWDPTFFEGEKVAPNPGITGAKISVWPDNRAAGTENEVQATMVDPLRFVSQVTWGAPNPDPTYAQFQRRSTALGHSPDWTTSGMVPVAAGRYTFTTAGRGLRTDADTLVLGRTPQRFALTPTADGYDTITAPDGRCAYVATPDGLGAPLLPGAPVTLTTCDPNDRSQRWQVQRTRGGWTITNALSELVAVTHGRQVLQQAPDVTRAATWRLRSA